MVLTEALVKRAAKILMRRASEKKKTVLPKKR